MGKITMFVKTITEGGVLKIDAPYNRSFIARIKKLDGEWIAPYWVVDVRQANRVHEILMDIYGEDGTDDNVERVNIRLTGWEWQSKESAVSSNRWAIGGRVIVYRVSRDSAVKVGPSVVAVDTEFAASAGSGKYPDIGCLTDDPTFEVYDLPLVMFHKIKDIDGVELLSEDSVEQEKRAQLENEKAKLLARIAEIEKELSK